MIVQLAALLVLCSAAAAPAQADNTLTLAESQAGWKLLFDGKTTKGWHNFRAKGVGPGWVVENGVLTSVNPDTAGDIVTDEKFEWFELVLDYRLTRGGNSGILIRVSDRGERTWHSGPEIQIYDDHGEPGAQKTGFLYQLYSSPVDSTKPPGQWNRMRILVSPQKCLTEINGVKYYEYRYGSYDFWQRVKKSKFSEYRNFGRTRRGSIGIQGDHGVVSFKNIKIRPIGRED